LEEERQQWKTDRAELEKELSRRSQELDAGWADLDARRAALEEKRRQWEVRRAEHESRSAERSADESKWDERDRAPEHSTRSSEAPADLQDVLRKMGSVDLLDDDSPPAEPAEPSPPRPTAAAVPPAPAASPPEDDEESIDDYMARLMERVRSITVGAGEPSPSSRAPQGIEGSLSRDASGRSPEANPPLHEPGKMSPRAVAPERAVDLSAMRELANLSAQTAIDRHSRRKKLHVSRSKLLVSLAALFVGGAMLGIWWTGEVGDLGYYSYYGAMACFALAALWAVPYALTVCRTMIAKPSQPAGHSPAEVVEQGGAAVPATDYELPKDGDEGAGQSDDRQ